MANLTDLANELTDRRFVRVGDVYKTRLGDHYTVQGLYYRRIDNKTTVEYKPVSGRDSCIDRAEDLQKYERISKGSGEILYRFTKRR